MAWLIELALVLLLIGGGWSLLNRGHKGDNRDSLTMRRVDAYIETIRRERRNPELAAMSDSELRDLLHSGARNLRVAQQKKTWILLGVAGVSLLAGIVVANQQGWTGFAIVAAVGALVAYGLNEFLTRQARAPLERRGVDIDRLKVE